MTRTTDKTKALQSQIEPAYTTAPVEVANSVLAVSQPEFLRLPKSGTKDPIYQHTRSAWNNLILPCKANNFRPPIKSISHRKVGAIRGVRLIVVASAREYFSKLIAEAEAADRARANESQQEPIGKFRKQYRQSAASSK